MPYCWVTKFINLQPNSAHFCYCRMIANNTRNASWVTILRKMSQEPAVLPMHCQIPPQPPMHCQIPPQSSGKAAVWRGQKWLGHDGRILVCTGPFSLLRPVLVELQSKVSEDPLWVKRLTEAFRGFKFLLAFSVSYYIPWMDTTYQLLVWLHHPGKPKIDLGCKLCYRLGCKNIE